MNTRFFGLILMALLALMVSCQPDDVLDLDEINTGSADEILPAQLPQSIQAYIERQYPNLSILEASVLVASDGSVLYAAAFSDGVERTFHGDSTMCSSIDPATLPQRVQDYVDQNFSNGLIVRAAERTDENGNQVYIVKLDTGEILAFDASGTFLFEKLKRRNRRGKRGNHPNRGKREVVQAADFPANMTTYLGTNYPNETVGEAKKLEFRDGTIVYVVKLADGTVLHFDDNGDHLPNFSPPWRN